MASRFPRVFLVVTSPGRSWSSFLHRSAPSLSHLSRLFAACFGLLAAVFSHHRTLSVSVDGRSSAAAGRLQCCRADDVFVAGWRKQSRPSVEQWSLVPRARRTLCRWSVLSYSGRVGPGLDLNGPHEENRTICLETLNMRSPSMLLSLNYFFTSFLTFDLGLVLDLVLLLFRTFCFHFR